MTNEVVLVLLFVSLALSDVGNAHFLHSEDGERDVVADRIDLLRAYIRRNDERRRDLNDELDNWQGRWMPERPGDRHAPPKILPKTDDAYQDLLPRLLHGVPMGQPSDHCDNAKTNLTLDWDGSPVNYTCYGRKIVPDRDTVAAKYCEQISKSYTAIHKCMHEKIEYDDNLPLFGAHRPLWPVYGEYKFLPKQRWLHSLEHGAIVMLYHPCTNPLEVKRLRSLVTRCLWRHVISPYNLLPEDRPLALLSWGCRLTMSHVNPAVVTRFIKDHALRGPEDIARDGDFDNELLTAAEVVSDRADSVLCPFVGRS